MTNTVYGNIQQTEDGTFKVYLTVTDGNIWGYPEEFDAFEDTQEQAVKAATDLIEEYIEACADSDDTDVYEIGGVRFLD